MKTVIFALFLYLIATIGYSLSEVYWLKAAMEKDWYKVAAWLSLKLILIPVYALGMYWLYNYNKSWWLVEFPYFIMGIGLSYVSFVSVLHVKVSWREIVSAILLLVIAILLKEPANE